MKRPGSSKAQFVQRIPRDVRTRAVGLRLRIPIGTGFVEKTISPTAQDVRFSLQTSDPLEVKARQAAAATHLAIVWENLRAAGATEPTRLLQVQIAALAGELHAAYMRAFEREPGPLERWDLALAAIDEARPHGKLSRTRECSRTTAGDTASRQSAGKSA